MILGVNIDHVATLRQARRGVDPDPVLAAPLAILGGADGITVHLREDRRHISDRDLRILREVVTIELNLEMAATKEMLGIATKTMPDMVTLVPEKREELTTEGGLDVKGQKSKIKNAIARLHDAGIPVSLFVNPDERDIDTSRDIGADMIEVHTGAYADARTRARVQTELRRVVNAVAHGVGVGLTVNVGHGLNYRNVSQIVELPGIRGLYIGHSIVSRAVYVGLERAVREMKALIEQAATRA